MPLPPLHHSRVAPLWPRASLRNVSDVCVADRVVFVLLGGAYAMGNSSATSSLRIWTRCCRWAVSGPR
jgi:hypothetical protein